MSDPIWVEKLEFLVQQDHSMREVLLQRGVLSDAYHPEMEKIHLSNAKKLSELINKNGFPVLSNAGDKGVRLSWLIIQHAISWPDFMRESLIQMRMAAAMGDYPLELIAYTEDRVAVFEGRPQLYGTSADWKDGELQRDTIEDPDKVDIRRKAIGLPPLASTSLHNSLDKPPKDPEKKARDYHEWLIRVGWRNPKSI